jgi:hypothetical protein
MAVAAPTLGAASAVRTSAGWLDVWSEHGPKLVKFGLQAWEDDARAEAADKKFGDELLATVRDATEVYVREVRRGLKDLETFTQPAKAAKRTASRKASRGKAASRARTASASAGKAAGKAAGAGRAAGKTTGRGKARRSVKRTAAAKRPPRAG